MTKLHLFVICVTIFVATTYGQQCNVVPKCTCQYGDESVDVEEQDTGSEALAGAVGALGSVMVTGGGFGLWYMLRGRKTGSVSDAFDRSDTMTDEPIGRGKGPPPQYNKEAGGGFNRNIYTASRNDNLSHKVGAPRLIP